MRSSAAGRASSGACTGNRIRIRDQAYPGNENRPGRGLDNSRPQRLGR